MTLAEYLDTRTLCHFLGEHDCSCSIGTINLFLGVGLYSLVPDSMSPIVGEFIIAVQDVLPLEVINSARWKKMLCAAMETGSEDEERRTLVVDTWIGEHIKPHLSEWTPGGSRYGVLAESKTFVMDARPLELLEELCTKASKD